jgi:hypothetical protein
MDGILDIFDQQVPPPPPAIWAICETPSAATCDIGAMAEIRFPSTGSHRLDWFIVLAVAIVLLIIFV